MGQIAHDWLFVGQPRVAVLPGPHLTPDFASDTVALILQQKRELPCFYSLGIEEMTGYAHSATC